MNPKIEAFSDNRAYEVFNAADMVQFLIGFATDKIYSQSTHFLTIVWKNSKQTRRKFMVEPSGKFISDRKLRNTITAAWKVLYALSARSISIIIISLILEKEDKSKYFETP